MSKIQRWGRHLHRLILRSLMELSAIPLLGGVAIRLAEAIVGPYKDRRILAQVSAKPYL